MIKRITSVLAISWLSMLANNIYASELSELFKKTSPSVVILHTFERVPKSDPVTKERMTSVEGLGSGVLISNDGLILTAAHVVHLADSIHVEFTNGEKVLGTVIASEPTADVSLIKAEKIPSGFKAVKLADSDKVTVGDNIYVIGAPYGIGHSLSAGLISGRRAPTDTSMFADVEFFQTDAAINQGNSGGPMFNMKGEVIGIVSHILSKSGGFEGMGFAVTSNTANQLLLKEKRIWGGIDIQILDGELAEIFQIPQSAGALVQRVATDSPAKKAGIQGGSIPANVGGRDLLLGGDIILNIENITIESRDSLKSIKKKIGNKKPGQKTNITVLRKGKTVTLTVHHPD